MHVLSEPAWLLALLLGVSGSSSSHSERYSEEKASDGASHNLNSVHNVTLDCGRRTVPKATVWRCQRDTVNMSHNGYPWFSHNSQGKHTNSPSRNNTLRDPLDALNQMCYVHDRSRICMEKIGFSSDYCLATTDFPYRTLDFHFVIINSVMRT